MDSSTNSRLLVNPQHYQQSQSHQDTLTYQICSVGTGQFELFQGYNQGFNPGYEQIQTILTSEN